MASTRSSQMVRAKLQFPSTSCCTSSLARCCTMILLFASRNARVRICLLFCSTRARSFLAQVLFWYPTCWVTLRQAFLVASSAWATSPRRHWWWASAVLLMRVVLSKCAFATSRRFPDTKVLFGRQFSSAAPWCWKFQFCSISQKGTRWAIFICQEKRLVLWMREIWCWCQCFDCCERKNKRKKKEWKEVKVVRGKPGWSV